VIIIRENVRLQDLGAGLHQVGVPRGQVSTPGGQRTVAGREDLEGLPGGNRGCDSAFSSVPPCHPHGGGGPHAGN